MYNDIQYSVSGIFSNANIESNLTMYNVAKLPNASYFATISSEYSRFPAIVTTNQEKTKQVQPPPGFANLSKEVQQKNRAYFDMNIMKAQKTSAFTLKKTLSNELSLRENTKNNSDEEDTDMFPVFPSLSMKAVMEVQNTMDKELLNNDRYIDDSVDFDSNENNVDIQDIQEMYDANINKNICKYEDQEINYQEFCEYISNKATEGLY
jgi:hypothetical protein